VGFTRNTQLGLTDGRGRRYVEANSGRVLVLAGQAVF